MSNDMDRLKESMLELAAKRSINVEDGQSRALSDANDDLPIWIDRMQRGFLKGEDHLFFTYGGNSTRNDPKSMGVIKTITLAESMALSKTPKAFSASLLRTPEYELAYAKALEELFGPPFTVQFGFVFVEPTPPSYEQKSFWSFSIRSNLNALDGNSLQKHKDEFKERSINHNSNSDPYSKGIEQRNDNKLPLLFIFSVLILMILVVVIVN